LTTTHIPPTQDPLEISTFRSSTPARNDLLEVSTSKGSRAEVSSVQSVAESNISVQTTKPETQESSIPPFGSRTSTSRQTSLETPRTTKITPAETSTRGQAQPETSSARSSTSSAPPVFGSRTATSSTTTTAEPPKDPADASSSARPVLKRPPVNPEPTTRSRPHTTEPIKEDTATPEPQPGVNVIKLSFVSSLTLRQNKLTRCTFFCLV